MIIAHEPRFFDPRNDVAFKHIFGQEDHKDVLIEFLNAVFEDRHQAPIESVELLNPFQIPSHKQAKRSIVDVLCKDQAGDIYIVEMQVPHQPDFLKRAQFYASNEYVSQLEVGEEYGELRPVILLSIVNHVLFPGNDKYISDHATLDIDTKDHHLKDVQYTFIELPKFTKTLDEARTIKEKWVYFFKNAHKDMDIPESVRGTKIYAAYESLERFRWNAEQRRAYFEANLALQDESVKLKDAIKRGEKKGREEGEKKGRHDEKLETARRLYILGISDDLIIQGTGISNKDLSSLKNEEK
jgi:predicted transposase/invertase (TIGR01784 family)